MGDAVVSAIVGPVFENLISLLNREFKSIQNVKKEVDRLLNKLSIIKLVLEDAEEKQINDKPIQKWLINLKDATYDAEDVLDEWSLKIQQEQEFSNKVCLPLSSCLNLKKIIFRREMAKKVKEIFSTFEQIEMQKSNLLTTNAVSQSESQFNNERETSSAMIEPHIYGRDVDRENIIGILVNDASNQQDVCVLPIVGMGGLGKTTLVQSVYNDDKVKSYFHKKIWVCVSEPFEVKRILKAIIEDSKSVSCGLDFLEPIRKKVAEILKDEKYLLVLDDLWNENQQEWDKLKSFLRGGAKGSAIIITTRSENVASFTGTLSTYHLDVLSNDDCWSLIKHRAFGSENVEDPNLVEIGKAIAKKCKGVPLAAKSLGSLLGSKTDVRHWERVRDNDVWKLKDNNILPILRLSYNKIPSQLKQCFAYCSIFPKDWEITKNKLIYLWIANGYIQSQEGVELEETGDEIFNQLLRWSFFQETKEDRYGNIYKCKMHDLMHDLACSVAVNECLDAKLGVTKEVPQKIRHLSVDCGPSQSSTDIDPPLTSQSSLRTLVFFHPIDIHSFEFSCTLRVLGLSSMSLETVPPSVCNLKHLRYLDLFDNELTSLPFSIGSLEQLRYLNLSRNCLTCLPESIHKLRNLQMLDLSSNKDMTSLPFSIGSLEQLRYLNLSWNSKMTSLPDSVCNLKHLRYLHLSYNEGMTSLPFSIGSLEQLRHLNLWWNSKMTSLPDSVSGLRNLQSLLLSNCRELKNLPERLGNMTSLKRLDLLGCYELVKMPVGIGRSTRLETLDRFVVGRPSDGDCGSISELQGLKQLRGVLKIRGLENVRNPEDAKMADLGNKQYLTELRLMYDEESEQRSDKKENVLEGLELPPNIKKLKIKGWETCFGEGFLGNLKDLGYLEIRRCQRLVCLPGGLEKLTSLERVSIEGCKSIKCLPAMGMQGVNTSSSLAKLEIRDCDSLTSVSEGLQHLTSLKELSIRRCAKLVFGEDDFQNLISLVDLRLEYLPNVTAVPEGLRYLTSLKELSIKSCTDLELETLDFHSLLSLETLKLNRMPQMTSLPEEIQHLPRLQHLEIWYCENLQTLPQWIKQLTTLQSLAIYRCHPELHAKCNKENGGEYWPLISHIPHIRIYTGSSDSD